jgi:hypothetical protein
MANHILAVMASGKHMMYDIKLDAMTCRARSRAELAAWREHK